MRLSANEASFDIDRRIQAFEQDRDPHPVLDPEAVTRARRLIAEMPAMDGLDQLAVAALLGNLFWTRYLLLPPGDDDDDLMLAVGFYREVEPFAPELIPAAARPMLERPVPGPAQWDEKTSALLAWVEVDPHPLAVDVVIGLLERTSAIDDPARGDRLTDLCVALQVRFEAAGRRDDIHRAVSVGRAAVAESARDRAEYARRCLNLGTALFIRYRGTSVRVDLDDAIEQLRRAACGAVRVASLANLGGALRLRYLRDGDPADLDEAVEAGWAAVREAPADHPHLDGTALNLAIALRARFLVGGRPADLDEAIELGRAGMADRSPVRRWGWLCTLANALRTRFRVTGDRGDLDEAAALLGAAVEAAAAGPDVARYRASQALVLEAGGHTAEALELWRVVSESADAEPEVRLTAAVAGAAAAAALAVSSPEAVAGYRRAMALLPLHVWRGQPRGDAEDLLSQLGGLGCDGCACAVASGDGGLAVVLLEQGRGVLWSQRVDMSAGSDAVRRVAPEVADRMDQVRIGLTLSL